MSFKLKFWGVRGSIACPSPDHIAFGGNTSCLEVNAGGEQIIFDAGTGIRNLGHWNFRKGITKATLMFSHTHWDHITGFPFFAPAFHPEHSFTLMAGHLKHQGGLYKVISGQMANPMFPVPIEALKSKLSFVDFDAGGDGGIDVFAGFERLDRLGGVQPVLGDDGDGVDVCLAEFVEGGTTVGNSVFFDVFPQFFGVEVAEDDLADQRVRFEQGDKALGEGADADDTYLEGHGDHRPVVLGVGAAAQSRERGERAQGGWEGLFFRGL